jgi:hypothetical protein
MSRARGLEINPPNPAAGKAGIASLLAMEHPCPGLPEHVRPPYGDRYSYVMRPLRYSIKGKGLFVAGVKLPLAWASWD